jgi:hypothetical protein
MHFDRVVMFQFGKVLFKESSFPSWNCSSFLWEEKEMDLNSPIIRFEHLLALLVAFGGRPPKDWESANLDKELSKALREVAFVRLQSADWMNIEKALSDALRTIKSAGDREALQQAAEALRFMPRRIEPDFDPACIDRLIQMHDDVKAELVLLEKESSS